MATKKTCASTTDLYEDVLKCPGEKRLPGTRAYGFFIPRRYITKFADGTQFESISKERILFGYDTIPSE